MVHFTHVVKFSISSHSSGKSWNVTADGLTLFSGHRLGRVPKVCSGHQPPLTDYSILNATLASTGSLEDSSYVTALGFKDTQRGDRLPRPPNKNKTGEKIMNAYLFFSLA